MTKQPVKRRSIEEIRASIRSVPTGFERHYNPSHPRRERRRLNISARQQRNRVRAARRATK